MAKPKAKREEALRLYEAGHSTAMVATLLGGVDDSTILRWVREAGIVRERSDAMAVAGQRRGEVFATQQDKKLARLAKQRGKPQRFLDIGAGDRVNIDEDLP